MVVWIIVGIAVLGLAVYAFWPHKRGIVDGDVRRSRHRDEGTAELYDRD